jgi:hypothetical protein
MQDLLMRSFWHPDCHVLFREASEVSSGNPGRGVYCAPSFFGCVRGKQQGEENLVRILRKLAIPATESQMGIALALSVVTMSLMLWAILWQSGVIDSQRDLIRVIWPGR